MQATGGRTFGERVIGAARLDPTTYEEIEHDQTATGQALLVVVLAALAIGIGRLGSPDAGRGLIGGVIDGILGWIVFSAFAYIVGAAIFASAGTRASWGELLRTIGFARAPRLLSVFGFIPLIGWIFVVVGWIWYLVATIVAIRQALDFTTERAVATAIVALIVEAIVSFVIALIFGLGALLFLGLR